MGEWVESVWVWLPMGWVSELYLFTVGLVVEIVNDFESSMEIV